MNHTVKDIEIPIWQPPKAIDFCPFMRMVGEKHGFNYRDMGGKFSGNENAEYQDVWHWLLNNRFDDLRRGGINYLHEEVLDDDDLPDYVRKCLDCVFLEGKKTDAYDPKDGCISFYIDW